jgi:hypothetical protein
VDFRALLPIIFGHDQEETPYQFSVNKTNGNFHLFPSIKKQKIHKIEQWTTAFMRFVAINATKYPLETPALMKYGELVRDLASKHSTKAWARYDFQFRTLGKKFKSHGTSYTWNSGSE